MQLECIATFQVTKADFYEDIEVISFVAGEPGLRHSRSDESSHFRGGRQVGHVQPGSVQNRAAHGQGLVQKVINP